jgi:8-amino-7-oxononanoate synthase
MIHSFYAQKTHDLKLSNLYRTRMEIEPIAGNLIRHQGQDYLNFSSNDYLGLRQHPALIQQSIEFIKRYGNGSGASSLVTGYLDSMQSIEIKMSALKGFEACLLMNSGYQANLSVLPALFDKKILGSKPLVLADKLSHASTIRGCLAAQDDIDFYRFTHNDMDHLSRLIEKHHKGQALFILSESVFSMDGHIAPLDDLYKIRDIYGGFLIIDEAHATGIMGSRGQGLAQKADLIIGTFGKAMGSFGAYVACTHIVRDYLINVCAGLIYSTALPPATLGAIDAAIDLMPSLSQQRTYTKDLSEFMRKALYDLGYDTGGSQSQIIPLIIGDEEKAVRLSQYLREQGFWINAIRPPTVPSGTARLRLIINAAHTQEDCEKLLEVLKHVTC